MPVSRLNKIVVGAISLVLLFMSNMALADIPLNMTQGVTPISREVYELHMIILWIVTIIAVLVFGVMFYSMLVHRKSKGAVAAQFHHSTAAEIAWTIIPILILVVMAVPATKTLIKMEKTEDAEITIKVTGIQWKWKYDYVDDGIDDGTEDGFSFISSLDQASNDARQKGSGIDPATVEHYLLNVDNPVVVPVNTKIRLLTTATDVIHAWWVPDLGWKRDAIPGFINDNWTIIEEEGTYRGNCAELCGKDHGFMPIVVEAVSQEKYAEWVATKKEEAAASAAGDNKTFTMEELMAKGEEVYATACAACHQANGQGVPGAFPALAGSKMATEDMAGHIDIVVNGKAGTAMGAFGEILSAADIAAVVTYERNAWGNDTGEMVQPADVNAAK